MDKKIILYVFAGLVASVIIAMLAKRAFEVLDNITSGVGLTDSKDEKEEKKDKMKLTAVAEKEDYFSPSYLSLAPAGATNRKLAYESNVNKIVDDLHSSVGLIWDSPAKASAAFGFVRYKIQVAQVAKAFNLKYKEDLYQFLKRRFDTSEQIAVFNDMIARLNKLPSGYVTRDGKNVPVVNK